MDYSLYPRNNVLCIDMKSFYASVECVERGLDPMTAMLAVVGDTQREGSIVLAASPALKKRYGVKSVSRFFEIPNDKRIIIAPARMEMYVKKSVEIMAYLENFAPPEAIHPYSIDESWITVDGTEHLFGTPWQIAEKIQQGIYNNFGIPCAIGIGDNKFLSKVVMDLYAKKYGIAECRYEEVQEMLWNAPIGDIWGIGSKTEEKLFFMGVRYLGELANCDLSILRKHFGIMGEQLYWHSWGVDLSPVLGDFSKPANKGYGHGITLLRDYDAKEVKTCILELCEEVCRRARRDKKVVQTIQLSIGYTRQNKGGFSRSKSIPIPTNITMEIYDICMQLFNKYYIGDPPIRRVYVSLSKLYPEPELQLDFFENRSKQDLIGKVMDGIRDKFGSTAILRASSYTDAGITLERSKKIGGHYA